jgi:lipopolysaccharide export system permease protein
VIVDRYVSAAIARPFGIGVGVLASVFAGYTAAVRLDDAAQGLMPLSSAARLILLNTVIALEILLPTALYFAVLSALGRLHGDSEIIALNAAGAGEYRVARPVLGVALLVAATTGVLSLYGRPWAYRESYRLESQAASDVTLDSIVAGRFLTLQNGRHVLYAGRVDRQRQRLEDVFLETDRGDSTQVIRARAATLASATDGAGQRLEFHDGYSYLLDRRGSTDVNLRFGVLDVELQPAVDAASARRKAASSASLAQSEKPRDIAEYQWRLSTPLATLLLALLAVPLSRGGPRHGRWRVHVIAVAVYTLLFNTVIFARNLVEQGAVGAVPGLWWVYGCAAGLLAVLMCRPRLLTGSAAP